MCADAIDVQAALLFQPFCVGKGYARHPSSKTTRVDAQDEVALVVIVVKLFVKGGGGGQCLRVFGKWVHHADALRQFDLQVEVSVKCDDPVGEGFVCHNFCLSAKKHIYVMCWFNMADVFRTLFYN